MLGIYIVLLSFLLSSSVFADPRQWEEEGLPVRAVSVIADFSSASRADGTTLVVWAQADNSLPMVKGQLVSSSGVELWTEGGILLAQGSEKASFPDVTAVDGGWVIVWLNGDVSFTGRGGERGDFYSNAELRAIKIDDNGVPIWAGGRSGVIVSPRLEWGEAKSYTVNPSGEGAIVTWNYWTDHDAQRLTATGQPAWPEPVALPRLNYLKNNFSSDGQGGVLFAWKAVSGNIVQLRANRLLPNGTFAWNSVDGAFLLEDSHIREIAVCADGTGGAFVTWTRSVEPKDPMAQRLGEQGQLLWPEAGVMVMNLSDQVDLLKIAPSISAGVVDGFVAVQREWNQDIMRLNGQKISLVGQRVWGDDAVLLCESGLQNAQVFTYSVESDRSGGLLCHMDTYVFDTQVHHNVAVMRVAADESRPWAEGCGVTVAATEDGWNFFSKPIVVSDKVRSLWLTRFAPESNKLRMQELDIATGTPETQDPVTLADGDAQDIRSLQAVKLNNGSTAMVWETRYGLNSTLFFQVLDVFGTPLLADRGLPLCVESDGTPVSGQDAALCADGSGGFFAVFRHYEGGVYQLRMSHIDGQGNPISAPEGVEYAFEDVVEFYSEYILCYPDGVGGCYVTAPGFSQNFVLHALLWRVDANCEPVWQEPLRLGNDQLDFGSYLIAPSEQNSILLGYAMLAFMDMEYRVARITAGGVVEWDVSVVPHINDYYWDVGACSDNMGGVYVTWHEWNETQDANRGYLQRISPSGDLLFGGGVLLTESEDETRGYNCSADVLGNVTIAWYRYTPAGIDIFAQRVGANGAIAWLENGLPVSTAPRDQYGPEVIALSDNEVYIVWRDERNSDPHNWAVDVYGTHLNARGQIGDDSYWQENGSPICDFPYYQATRTTIADGAGGVIVAWVDSRTGFGNEYSVFAQRLYDPIFTDAEETPVVPQEFSLSQNYPNPFNPETVIEFALPNSAKTSLRVFDVTGRLVTTLVDQPLTAGVHRVNFDATRFASGVYFYRLKAGENTSTRKMVLLK